MSDLLSNLGLEFVDPTTINTGLKQLKPSDEPQIFSVILGIPGLENTTIKYSRHNFYNQIKRNIRCSGGSCCVKAQELHDWLAKLPDDDQRKRQRPLAQTRYILPVVLYQGKTAQAYGGPVEVRYIDISAPTYIKWDQARAAVNEDIAPFYQRDFIMTQDASIKGVPVMTHLESKAKWLTDPALNAEVRNVISNPDFIQNYVKVVPPKMSEEDFLNAWNTAMAAKTQTVAEQAVNASQQTIIQPAVSMPSMTGVSVQIPQPIQVTPAQPINVDMNVMNTPTPTVQVETTQPVQVETPQPVQPTQPINQQVPINTGIPVTTTPATNPSVDVPYTPQNIITGAYSTGAPTSTVLPESVINMQPVQLAPAEAVNPQTVTPAPAPAPSTSQSEISLTNVEDLDAILKSLPQ